MKRIICWIRTILRTKERIIKTGDFDGINISGHNYIEQLNGDLVCEVCGYISSSNQSKE